jgi:Ca-activated chloride channel homolog
MTPSALKLPMTFFWPEMLWGLVALPLLVLLYVWLLRRRKKTAVRYASLSLVKEAMGRGASAHRFFDEALPGAGTCHRHCC